MGHGTYNHFAGSIEGWLGEAVEVYSGSVVMRSDLITSAAQATGGPGALGGNYSGPAAGLFSETRDIGNKTVSLGLIMLRQLAFELLHTVKLLDYSELPNMLQ